ncbi:MAG TPA: (Fe-S)-binding protein [Syntrophomonadaceae bacterium]|nr:(Fe-S)-binding protein [Syntrophomonadaceae bacterium]
MQDHSFYEGLKKESLICAQCGYCRVECPVYKQIGWESSSPRAKMLLAGKIADGNQINEQEALRIFQCTMCGRCKEQCSTRIDTIKVWEDLRQEIAEQGKSPGNLRILTQTIEENGNITGDEQANRELWIDALDDDKYRQRIGSRGKVLYFTGCSGALYPQVNSIPRSFVQILETAEEDYTLLGADESCCGFPLIAAGQPDLARDLMQRNLDKIKQLGVETIVTTCPSCYHSWRDTYPEFLGADLPYKIMHASQLINEYIKQDRLPLKELDEVVTYHDPCDLGRNSGVYDEPRFVIQSIPGVDFREMDRSRENAACCGGGGNLEAVDDGLVAKIAQQRLEEITGTGAKTVISSCQQCKRTLQVNARKNKIRVRVMDLTEFVLKSIKT